MSHKLWTVDFWKTPQPWRWQVGPAESHSFFHLGWHLKLHGERACGFVLEDIRHISLCISNFTHIDFLDLSSFGMFYNSKFFHLSSFLRAPLATVDLLLCRCCLPSANGMRSHQAAGWCSHLTCGTSAHRAICSSNWWEFREIREQFYLLTPFPSIHPPLLPFILQNSELLPNQLWQDAQRPLIVYHKRD